MTAVWVIAAFHNRYPDGAIIGVAATEERAKALAAARLAENDTDYSAWTQWAPEWLELTGDEWTVKATRQEVQA